jgi:hypothetical protein
MPPDLKDCNKDRKLKAGRDTYIDTHTDTHKNTSAVIVS